MPRTACDYHLMPESTSTARAAALGFAIPPRTMLLVEDSRFAAEAVRLLCRRAGIRLRRADSLAAAALHLRVYRPDIALIDLGLPDGSGLELIASLAVSHLRPRRLVAVSGDIGLEPVAIAAGADAFLAKPVSLARHLALLTGEAGTTQATLEGEMPRERIAAADPLALRDDLLHLRAMLENGADPSPGREAGRESGAGNLRYAGQFLASVGRAMQDQALAEAAESAAHRGDRGLLVALVEARTRTTPTL